MPDFGIIEAFDLAVRTGLAFGHPGERPQSCMVRLKTPKQPREIAGSNLIAFLADRWSAERPALVVKEAPFALGAFARQGSQAAVVMAYGLHLILEAMCVRFGIPWQEAHPATIRKHFLDRARLGTREETKRAVIARCHLLGYLPKDCQDDNRADACATFDWAAATLAHHSPRELVMFGETPR